MYAYYQNKTKQTNAPPHQLVKLLVLCYFLANNCAHVRAFGFKYFCCCLAGSSFLLNKCI